MPFKNKNREKFIRRIKAISKLGFYISSDVDKIVSDIKLLNKRIDEIKKQIVNGIIYKDSGLALIQKYKRIKK